MILRKKYYFLGKVIRNQKYDDIYICESEDLQKWNDYKIINITNHSKLVMSIK